MLVHCKTSGYDFAVDLPFSRTAFFSGLKGQLILFGDVFKTNGPEHTFCPGPRVPKTVDHSEILRPWNQASN